jgi:hypothetical protein
MSHYRTIGRLEDCNLAETEKEYRIVTLQNQRKSTGLSPCRTRGRVHGCNPAEPEEEYRTVTL